MDSTTLKVQIDTNITNKIGVGSISKTDVGGELKSVVDYVDQQVPIKTSAIVSLSSSVQNVLSRDINACNVEDGLCYLPTTTSIGKEVLVLAVSNNIHVYANQANTVKMFATYGTMISNIILTVNQFYRFTYLGLGTGLGGVVDGYWKAELI